MIGHLHKLGQHSNWAFPIEQGKGGRKSLFGGGGGAWQSQKSQDIVNVYFFSLRRAVDGILIFSRILTIDRCYFFFLSRFTLLRS